MDRPTSENMLEDELHRPDGETDWLDKARNSFNQSTTFVDAHLRKTWERSIDMFQSKHPSGSKYNADAYKNRSRLFRPKSRATIRKSEAAAAAAFFSTADIVSVRPRDDGNPEQLVSAEMMGSILNYRLSYTIPWFRVCMAAYQTAQVHGVCVSMQSWLYEETEKEQVVPSMDPLTNLPIIDAETGMPTMETITVTEVVRDEPVVTLIPPENFRIHPGADWLDPVRSSPYLVYMIPTYAGEVRRRAEATDPKTGQPQWKDVDTSALRASVIDEASSIRQKREGYDRFDTQRVEEPVPDNEMVWVHLNIMQDEDRQDHVFWTLGTEAMLTDPVPLKEVYPHGRPFTMGVGNLEAFKVFPQSKLAMGDSLQQEANDIANLRLDNVKLALQPTVQVRAGAKVDQQALSRAVPGRVMAVQNPGQDIVYDRPPEVTQSSYAEQDRLNVDYDELLGAFSAGSVMSNRKLNETVGGMNLLSNGASQITEYDLRVFTETWVEPTLRQLIKLEQTFETDDVVLNLAARQSSASIQRYGINPQLDKALEQELTLTVNVGMGFTDPAQRVQKFVTAMHAVMQMGGGLAQMFGPQVLQSPAFQNISKEIFGGIGYKDSSRFLDFGGLPPGGGQQKEDHSAAVAQMQSQTQLQATQMQIASREKTELAKAQLKLQADAQKSKDKREAEAAKYQLESARIQANVEIARYRADAAAAALREKSIGDASVKAALAQQSHQHRLAENHLDNMAAADMQATQLAAQPEPNLGDLGDNQ